MASSRPLSSSTMKGQTAMVCQLCENDPKIKWKCLECGLMMCQRCRDVVHLKFASAKDHTIIDIKDISKHQEEQKLDFTKLKCTKHDGQNCCLFCKPCEELVCPFCISKTHNKHEMKEMDVGYKKWVEKIRNRQEDIKEDMETLSKRQEELCKIKYTEQTSYNKSKQRILNYKKFLIESIEKHCDKLLSELDQNWDDISQSIEKAEQKWKGMQNKLTQENDQVNEALQSNDAIKVFSINLTKPTRVNTEPLQTTFDHVHNFVPGDLSKVTLLHGSLKKVCFPHDVEHNVENYLTTPSSNIHCLNVCKDVSFWIYDNGLEVVQRVKPASSSIKVLSNFKLNIKGMALASSGDLLISVLGSSIVKVIPSGTEIVKDSTYNLSPLQPIGIHVTQDNKVIITAKEQGPFFPVNGPRQVIVLDHSGRQEKVFQDDIHNKPLFTYPFRVTSTSNGNIGVVDTLSTGIKRVIILNNEGEIINIYTGHPDVNTDEKPFQPFDIKTTPSDNFVIADCHNHTLHLLSSNGEIIMYCNTEELGIEFPYCVSFKNAGQLYIGCVTFKDKKAKIYRIKNFLL